MSSDWEDEEPAQGLVPMTRKDEVISAALSGVETAECTLISMFVKIGQMTDDGILNLMRSMHRVSAVGWIGRAICAAEIQQRVAIRLTGGRGCEDYDSQSVVKQMKILASECGVDVQSIRTDARIINTFFTDKDGEIKADLEAEQVLDRGYYRACLSAPDPLKSIERVHQKLSDTGYTVKQCESDIRALRKADKAGEPEPELEKIIWLNDCPITPEANALLNALCDHYQKSRGETIVDAVKLLYEKMQAQANL